MKTRPDVSAVILSLGEPFVPRAIESLSTQTVPLRKVIVVERVSPFARALNEGARQVETQFFVQVDADMVLDPHCVESLLGAVRDDTGIVVGELRDELAGQVVGVKLFRTECFRRATMPDTLAPDTDMVERWRRLGWKTEYFAPVEGGLRPAFGEHRPDYTPAYTFRKFVVEGGRLRHRAARHGLFWRMGVLESSRHPLARLAQLALGHGFFFQSDRDELRPVAEDPRGQWLADLLISDTRCDAASDTLLPITRHRRLRDVFTRFLEAGQALAAQEAGATIRDTLAGLGPVRRNPPALVANVALGHGVLMDEGDRQRLPRDLRDFGRFIVFSLGSRSSAWDQVRARVRALVDARPSAQHVPW